MNMNKITFDCTVDKNDIHFEDGKQAKIIDLCVDSGDCDDGVWCRLQSWCENGADHPEVDALIKEGKRYRVTIEEIEE